jgi:hypothetical protein
MFRALSAEHPIGGRRQSLARDPETSTWFRQRGASRLHYPRDECPRQPLLATRVLGIRPGFGRELPSGPIGRNCQDKRRDPIAGTVVDEQGRTRPLAATECTCPDQVRRFFAYVLEQQGAAMCRVALSRRPLGHPLLHGGSRPIVVDCGRVSHRVSRVAERLMPTELPALFVQSTRHPARHSQCDSVGLHRVTRTTRRTGRPPRRGLDSIPRARHRVARPG